MKTEKEIAAANQYAAYQKGWTAGTATRAMDPAVTGHADESIRCAYEQGYGDGRIAKQSALQKAADKYGHRPSILRLTPEEGVERDLHA